MKKIFLLIGQKGSGKSYVGSLFEQYFDIEFIRVEDWAKQIKNDRAIDNENYLQQVFQVIENGIRERLKHTDQLVFESTGLTVHFDNMLQSLSHDFKVHTIGIDANETTCLERVKKRDQNIHINVSDDQVLLINEKVRERDFPSDYRINNQQKTEQELIAEIEHLLKLTKNAI